MNEASTIKDSSPSVTLTVGQLRALLRQEIEAAIGQDNGKVHHPTLLTAEELAKTLKVKKSWVYDATRKKENPIPHIRVGRYFRFDLYKVLPWFEDHQGKN